MVDLVISPGAEQDLRDIWRFIATGNLEAADQLLLRIDAKLQILRDFPAIGTVRDDIRPGFRMLVEGNYLLLYEYQTANNVVELVAVVDGRRDLGDLF